MTIEKDFVLSARKRDLGGFAVARSIPSPERRFLGPFVFLDHLGPMRVTDTRALDVRPHPHIGLSTVTYLFDGRGFHRDSLGSSQVIAPGELNWMTAGRGIVHSERSPKEDRGPEGKVSLHGVQVWVALPVEFEKIEPSFTHYPKDVIPSLELHAHLKGKLLIGEYKDVKSPVKTYSRTFFAEVDADMDVATKISIDEEEIGIFLIKGEATVNGHELQMDDLIFIANPKEITIEAGVGAKLVFVGGTTFPEPRFIWWNFVSSSKEAIHEAAKKWERQEMGTVPDEDDFIPLPNDQLP